LSEKIEISKDEYEKLSFYKAIFEKITGVRDGCLELDDFSLMYDDWMNGAKFYFLEDKISVRLKILEKDFLEQKDSLERKIWKIITKHQAGKISSIFTNYNLKLLSVTHDGFEVEYQYGVFEKLRNVCNYMRKVISTLAENVLKEMTEEKINAIILSDELKVPEEQNLLEGVKR